MDGSWTWISIPVTLKLLSVKMTLSARLTYVTSGCSLEFSLEIPPQLISPLILLRTYITPFFQCLQQEEWAELSSFTTCS